MHRWSADRTLPYRADREQRGVHPVTEDRPLCRYRYPRENAYTRFVTTKERLHQLVDQLGDEQAAELLRLADAVLDVPTPVRARPSWVGALRSAEPNLAERSEDILRDELGHHAA